jgi:hypothetical protein
MVYEALRARALHHYQLGALPILSLCAKPLGAYIWAPSAQWDEIPEWAEYEEA